MKNKGCQLEYENNIKILLKNTNEIIQLHIEGRK